MNIGSSTTAQQSASVSKSSSQAKVALEVMLLKKSLEMQLNQAAMIVDQLGGKGQIIDLRV